MYFQSWSGHCHRDDRDAVKDTDKLKVTFGPTEHYLYRPDVNTPVNTNCKAVTRSASVRQESSRREPKPARRTLSQRLNRARITPQLLLSDQSDVDQITPHDNGHDVSTARVSKNDVISNMARHIVTSDNGGTSHMISNDDIAHINVDDVNMFPENTPMVIVDSFEPSANYRWLPISHNITLAHMISVKRGEIVNAVSKRGGWLNVQTYRGESGLIPE